MNEARIVVGIAAVGIASAAYHAALEYAKERHQGRPLAAKDPLSPQIPIIEHADVKRMLFSNGPSSRVLLRSLCSAGNTLIWKRIHLKIFFRSEFDYKYDFCMFYVV